MSNSSSESSESEHLNQYENDGFVVPDNEASEEEELPVKRRASTKRRHRLRKFEKEEEDLDLIQENLGIAASPSSSDRSEERTTKKLIKSEKVVKTEKSDRMDRSPSDTESDTERFQRTNIAESIFGPSTDILPPETETPAPAALDPTDAKAHFLGEEFDLIRETDIPERLQHIFRNREYPEESEILLETSWLAQNMQKIKTESSITDLEEAIKKFLLYYRAEKYEVFYIARYQLHELRPGLDSEHDLLRLVALDKEWGHIFSVKQSYAQFFTNVPVCVQELITKTSPDGHYWELADLEAYAKVHIYPFGTGGDQSLRSCVENGLGHMIEVSSLTPVQLYENLKQKKLVTAPPTPPDSPQELALQLVCQVYPEEIRVMRAVCTLQAAQLAAHPLLRQVVREEYLEYVMAYTSPTPLGKSSLDVFHPCYRVKNICRGKAVSTWTEHQLAEAFICEKQNLIDFKIGLPWTEEVDDKILAELKDCYLGPDAEEWNQFREEVLKFALQRMYSELSTELKNKLFLQVQEWLVTQVQKRFHGLLARTPFTCEDGGKPVVFSFVIDSDARQIAMTVLNPNGDIQFTRVLGAPLLYNPNTDHKKRLFNEDRKKLLEELLYFRPDAIVVGADSILSLNFHKTLYKFLEAIRSGQTEISDVEADSSFTPSLLLEPTEIPILFARSSRADSLFPDYPWPVRASVSLGRFLQSPICEILQLSLDPTESQLLKLNVHPLQALLSRNAFQDALETVAADIVSSEGVFINEAVERSHLSSVLAFVPGLGLVKSQALISGIKIKLAGQVSMRASLIAKRLLGERIYNNAVGFLRIAYDEDTTDPLDATRIHPNQYDCAKLIAESALDVSGDPYVIHRVMKTPYLMESLDLDAFAEMLQEHSKINMKSVLEFIVRELTVPYSQAKKEYSQLPPETLFYLCTRETKHSLRIGTLAHATVIAYNDDKKFLRCKLECGADAMVDEEKIPSQETSIEDAFPVGNTVLTRVLDISFRYQDTLLTRIKLSLLPDDVRNHSKFLTIKLDDAFIVDDNDWVEEEVEDPLLSGQKYIPRIINHPRYKNIGLGTVLAELLPEDIGSYRFRPSSKGSDHMTLTWKFYDDIFVHIDIREENKPAANMLGTKLWISEESFETLNEITDRYLKPCEVLTKESISHYRFEHNSENIIQKLELEKERNPASIPYKVYVSRAHPQYFLLSYMPSSKVITEYIKVKPKGLFFHELYHSSMSYLIHWFKKHYNDRVYKICLSKAKEPLIDHRNHYSIPPVPKAGLDNDETEHLPQILQTPIHGDSTPYLKTPRIGAEEWAGRKELNHTPRADHWEHQRNLESWKPPAGVPPVPETNWASEIKDPGKSCFNCGESGHFARECTQNTQNTRGNRRGRGQGRGRGTRNNSSSRDDSSGGSWGNSGQDSSWGNSGQDGSWGNSGQDSSWGNSGQDSSWGNSGQSSSWGNSGQDTSGGNSGQDSSWGNSGQDSSWGNSGQSSSWGNSGQDTSGGNSGQGSSWGNSGNSSQPPQSSWGNSEQQSDWSGKSEQKTWGQDGGQPSQGGWGSSQTQAQQSSWGTENKQPDSGGWGNSSQPQESSWGDGGQSQQATWGSESSEQNTWGKQPAQSNDKPSSW